MFGHNLLLKLKIYLKILFNLLNYVYPKKQVVILNWNSWTNNKFILYPAQINED